jgi:sugar phosphate isomerase/epimerase
MFWAGNNPEETLQLLVSMGVRCGQLGIPGDYDLTNAAPEWKDAAKALDFRIYTVFAAYEGESYDDVETVRETVGFVPPVTREQRELRTLEVSRFASEIGAPSIATHIGCIPQYRHDPEYSELVKLVRRICDVAAQFDQNFALETGQEPAGELLEFLHEVNRGNLGINFDPANMILYGTGDPVDALHVLRHHIFSVHCKDGIWPAARGALGREMPLGTGDVNWEKFLAMLQQIGYHGPLAIERETPDAAQRLADIRSGLALLRELQLLGG